MTDYRTTSADERLRQEFNQWAEEGKGEEMEGHHISITQQTLERMRSEAGRARAGLGVRRWLGDAFAGAGGSLGAEARAGDRARRIGRDDSPRAGRLQGL